MIVMIFGIQMESLPTYMYDVSLPLIINKWLPAAPVSISVLQPTITALQALTVNIFCLRSNCRSLHRYPNTYFRLASNYSTLLSSLFLNGSSGDVSRFPPGLIKILLITRNTNKYRQVWSIPDRHHYLLWTYGVKSLTDLWLTQNSPNIQMCTLRYEM